MRVAVLGNGSLSMTFDERAVLRELFYPVVGLTNHAAEHGGADVILRSGGRNIDLASPEWSFTAGYRSGMSFIWKMEHRYSPLCVTVHDSVDPVDCVWVRKMRLYMKEKSVRHEALIDVYLRLNLAIQGNDVGETGVFDPDKGRLYHYKGNVWLGVSGLPDNECRGDRALSARVAKVRDGGVRIGDDGSLIGSLIDHGRVESLMRNSGHVNPPLDITFCFALGDTRKSVDSLIDRHLSRAASEVSAKRWTTIHSSRIYREGAVRETCQVGRLRDTSVKVIVSHCDDGGGIVAALDDDVMTDYRDHYRYVWLRDATMCASAMISWGHLWVAERLLKFAARLPSSSGLYWQRYRPDGTVGSTWHPWLQPRGELPVQEDETGLVLLLAWQYLVAGGDYRLIDSLYESLIKPKAVAIAEYTSANGLFVRPSYDLWEERKGIFGFTQAASAAGLLASANIAANLAYPERKQLQEVADGLLEGLAFRMPVAGLGFPRGYSEWDDEWTPKAPDFTADASLFLIPIMMETFSPESGCEVCLSKEIYSRICEASRDTWRRLQTLIGLPGPNGSTLYARYEGDPYCRPGDGGGFPGNPWLVTTGWSAKAGMLLGLMSQAEASTSLKAMEDLATSSGLMPEQLRCTDLQPVSVCPLSWSHAAYLDLLNYTLAAGRSVDSQTQR